MRKEIMGLIVGFGVVYAQAGVANDLNRQDQARTTASSEAKSKHVANKQQSKQFATQNYYKHDKQARNTKQQGDQYSRTTSYSANQHYLNSAERDLTTNDSELRNHR